MGGFLGIYRKGGPIYGGIPWDLPQGGTHLWGDSLGFTARGDWLR